MTTTNPLYAPDRTHATTPRAERAPTHLVGRHAACVTCGVSTLVTEHTPVREVWPPHRAGPSWWPLCAGCRATAEQSADHLTELAQHAALLLSFRCDRFERPDDPDLVACAPMLPLASEHERRNRLPFDHVTDAEVRAIADAIDARREARRPQPAPNGLPCAFCGTSVAFGWKHHDIPAGFLRGRARTNRRTEHYGCGLCSEAVRAAHVWSDRTRSYLKLTAEHRGTPPRWQSPSPSHGQDVVLACEIDPDTLDGLPWGHRDELTDRQP